MTTKYNITGDINGRNGFGIQPSKDIQGTTLAQNVAQTFTVPSSYKNWIAIIRVSPAANVFVSFTTTAAAYTGSVASVSSILITGEIARQVTAGQSISVLTPDTTTPRICIEYQAILPYTMNPVQ